MFGVHVCGVLVSVHSGFEPIGLAAVLEAVRGELRAVLAHCGRVDDLSRRGVLAPVQTAIVRGCSRGWRLVIGLLRPCTADAVSKYAA